MEIIAAGPHKNKRLYSLTKEGREVIITDEKSEGDIDSFCTGKLAI